MYNRQSTTYNPFKKKRFGGAGCERLLAILNVVAIFGGAVLCVWQFAMNSLKTIDWSGFMSFGAPLLIGGIAFLIITKKISAVHHIRTLIRSGLRGHWQSGYVCPGCWHFSKVINIYQRGIQKRTC